MRYLSTIRIFLDNLTLNLVQTSVESESQKLEHVLEESNVRTKTKIKERLKDENKYFSKYSRSFLCFKQRAYLAKNVCHIYLWWLWNKTHCSLLSFTSAYSKRNHCHLSADHKNLCSASILWQQSPWFLKFCISIPLKGKTLLCSGFSYFYICYSESGEMQEAEG